MDPNQNFPSYRSAPPPPPTHTQQPSQPIPRHSSLTRSGSLVGDEAFGASVSSVNSNPPTPATGSLDRSNLGGGSSSTNNSRAQLEVQNLQKAMASQSQALRKINAEVNSLRERNEYLESYLQDQQRMSSSYTDSMGFVTPNSMGAMSPNGPMPMAHLPPPQQHGYSSSMGSPLTHSHTPPGASTPNRDNMTPVNHPSGGGAPPSTSNQNLSLLHNSASPNRKLTKKQQEEQTKDARIQFLEKLLNAKDQELAKYAGQGPSTCNVSCQTEPPERFAISVQTEEDEELARGVKGGVKTIDIAVREATAKLALQRQLTVKVSTRPPGQGQQGSGPQHRRESSLASNRSATPPPPNLSSGRWADESADIDLPLGGESADRDFGGNRAGQSFTGSTSSFGSACPSPAAKPQTGTESLDSSRRGSGLTEGREVFGTGRTSSSLGNSTRGANSSLTRRGSEKKKAKWTPSNSLRSDPGDN